MSFGETIGSQMGTDGAKILVWGAVGDLLKSLDKQRMLALVQHDPDFYLSVIANMETDTLIDKILQLSEDGEETDGDFKEIEKMVYKINKLDTIFAEATEFLHESGDMLATGSFITGEFEQKKAILKTMGRVTDDKQINNSNMGNDGKPKVNVVSITP